MVKTFSAVIDAGAGFSEPVPVAGLAGWTVYKQGQTEIYKITHNLGLTNPALQLHIVATPMTPDTVLSIGNLSANHFVVSAWGASEFVPKETDFMFVAVKK